MSDISGTLDNIAKERKRPMPTPPVGMPVVWFLGGDEANPRPALVTQVEGPGRVSLVVLPLNTMPQHKMGVLYKDHPDMEEANTPAKRTKGSWDYIPGFPSMIPKEHFEHHKQLLDRREKQAMAQLEQEEREAAAMAARKKESAAKREAAAV